MNILVYVQRVARRTIRRFVWSTVLVLLLVAGTFLFANRQLIADEISANAFHAPAEIVEIKDNLDLTKNGNRVFFATEPQIENSDAFNENCYTSTHTGDGALLGCYVDGKIHLFHIDDERLNGIVEVTAAHELLHAVYERMSHRDTERMQKKLITLYEDKLENSPEFSERMEVYAHLSSARLANELHSVFGTEVEELPDWLETHYATYFENRQLIVSFYDSYREIFEELRVQGLELKEQLDELTDEIDAAIDSYTAEVLEFNREWEAFKKQNEEYVFAKTPDEFYARKNMFDVWRADIENQKSVIEEHILEHDQLREELETLNHVSLDLMRSMDSEFLATDN